MDETIEFFDETAAFYDQFYEQRDLEDVSFYVERAEQTDGPVLEVGCGTGRVYLELLEAGVDADGFDGSGEMLSVLRNRAADRDLEPTVWEADMRSFEVNREYGLIIVPFRTFLHLQSIDDQLDALRAFHSALAPDGEVVIACFVPAFDVICERYGQWEETTIEKDGTEYQVRDRTEIVDEIEQIVRGTREFVSPEGETVAEKSFRLKLMPKREFELLFEVSPFASAEVYGGFDLEPLESPEQEMVWILED